MIKLIIGRQVEIRGLSVKIANHIKRTLRIENPAYARVRQMTGNQWAARQYYKYYSETPLGYLLVPRGFRQRVEDFLTKMGEEHEVVWETVERICEMKFKGKVTLRDYQVPVVESVLGNNEGIIKMSTGSGKTVVAVDLVRRLGLTATILVPNTVLLNQFVEEFKRHLKIDVGVWGDGRKDLKDITVATFQSLGSDPVYLHALCERTSVLIVDECQGAISPEREKILKKFKPIHWFGLSATPFRSKDDGRSAAVGFWFGGVIASYEAVTLAPEVHVVATEAELMVDEYPRIIEQMISHNGRNTLIAGLALGEALSGRKVMILVKRIEHYQRLQELMPASESILYIESSNPDRNTLLGALKQGKRPFQILLGTTSLLAVGTDIPSLDTLIIACDLKSDVLAEQAAGRVLRLFAGKPTPRVYDLWDNKNPILTRQFWQRKDVYLRKGWRMV